MGRGFKTNIESATTRNNYYRKVLFTTRSMQLVVMSLAPGEDIGMEKHPHTSQFIRVEKGRGKAVLGKRSATVYRLKDNDAVIIPPNTWHNIVNTSKRRPLKLYTIYCPPEHKPQTRQQVKS